MGMSTLQVNTIETSTVGGVLAIRDSNDALTSIQPSALRSTAASSAPTFQDSDGSEIGTLCLAWVKMTGTATPAIARSFNVSTITDLAVGSWRVNFTTPMPNTHYVGFATFDGNWNLTSGMVSPNTTTVNITSKNGSAGAGYDPSVMYIGFFG